MNYEIQQIDIDMLKARVSTVWIKFEIANIYNYENGKKVFNSSFKPIADISGELLNGSYSSDSTSDIRRTFSTTFYAQNDNFQIASNKNMWLNKFVIAYIGVLNHYVENMKFYPLGVYIIQDASYSYSATENTVSFNCDDLVTMLNGDRSGIIPGVQDMEINCVPAINDVSITENDSHKIININIINKDYTPLTDSDTAPYFDLEVGFNIPKEKMKYIQSYYEGWNVTVSINNSKSYFLIDYVKHQKVKFTDLTLGQDYITNFYGNNLSSYSFILLGKPNTISGAMSNIITQFSPFNYMIDDIGADVTNVDGSNATYIPYDLTFSTGVTNWEVISKLRDLYSGWEAFFDVYGNFICSKIPTCEDDECLVTADVFDSIVISEKDTYELNSIKNVVEVWGKNQETDRYDDTSTYTLDLINNKCILDLSLSLYACDSTGKHNSPYIYTNELIGFTCPNISDDDRRLIKTYNIPIYVRVNYNKTSDENLDEILLIADATNKNRTTIDEIINGVGYCFTPKYILDTCYAIFNGEFQVHAIALNVDKEPTDEEKENYKKYYNCNQISYIYSSGNRIFYTNEGEQYEKYIEQSSPYSVNEVGELIKVLSGEEYEAIYTTDLARQRAEYEVWKSARLTDSITINTVLIPFLYENIKVQYKSIRTGETAEYIIDKVSHSFDSYTTSIQMHKFYSAYPTIVKNK